MLHLVFYKFYLIIGSILEPANDFLFDFGSHGGMATMSIQDSELIQTWDGVCFCYVGR